MAASVYATPPPDHLSDDETALSDVSNSSQLSSPSNSMKTLKLDLLPDNSKKRRKQSTPIRISAEVAAATAVSAASAAVAAAAAVATAAVTTKNENNNCNNVESLKKSSEITSSLSPPPPPPITTNTPTTMPRIYLSNISQLQQKHSPPLSLLSQSQTDVVDYTKQDRDDDCASGGDQKENGKHNVKRHNDIMTASANLLRKYVNNLNCDQCGLKLDSEIKLGLHILQEHGPRNFALGDQSAEDEIPKLFVKKEPMLLSSSSSTANDWDHGGGGNGGSNSATTGDDKDKSPITSNGGSGNVAGLKSDDWLSLGLPFPFPPETAAMLSASGYLPQLSLLGVAGVSPFTGGDGLSRANAPPLRIFNPEAYCDLCNKEFCNKYFLKTHKANKHNIYEPVVSSATDLPSTSQLNLNMSVFQMQQQAAAQQLVSPKSSPSQQQQQQSQPHQQQQQTPSNASQSSGATPTQDMPIFCDICLKRFANVFAMRRHRSKVHEIPPPTNSDGSTAAEGKSSASASNTSTPLTVPDGFREDFSIEQEDTTFTPQPRKLSPQSIQQAREANFSFDKLKRLGVINPEAFCELCGKEYCNKYFLRTHKIKRHSIMVSNDETNAPIKEERSMPISTASMAAAWQLMQNAPLNLMIGTAAEQIQQFHRKKLEAGEIRSSSIDSIDDDYEQAPKRRRTNEEKKSLIALRAAAAAAADNCDENDCDEDECDQKLSDVSMNHHHHQQQLHDDDVVGPTIRSNPFANWTELANQSNATKPLSVDLQKLQSMIMQLNDLNAQRPVSCAVCGKEQENRFALHSHMLTEHSGLGNVAVNDNNNGHKVSPSTSPGSCQQSGMEVSCKHCDKDFASAFALTQHLFEAHGIQPSSPIRDGFITPERPISGLSLPPVQAPQSTTGSIGSGSGSGSVGGGSGGNSGTANGTAGGPPDRRPYTITPTSSYCEICNKELCNKYFMKTHMQRMHGIEIENGAQIGGVVCNICNKELCSKYFLRVHKHNTHGIIEEGSPLPQPRQNGDNANNANAQAAAEAVNNDTMFASMDSTSSSVPPLPPSSQSSSGPLKPGEVSDLNNRYFTHFTEVCPLCSRRFRGSKWLRTHLLADHGKSGTDKLRELEQQLAQMPKTSASPTLKIPNCVFSLNANETNFLQQQQQQQQKHALTNLFGGEDATAANTSVSSSSSSSTTFASKQKEHQCSFCSFSTPSMTFLIMHEQSHSLLGSATLPHPTNGDDATNESIGGVASSSDAITSEAINAHGKQHAVNNNNRNSNTTPTPATTPIPKQQQHEAHAILMDMANLTQRPTTYAIPQEMDNTMFMQSFLMEPLDSSSIHSGDNDDDHNSIGASRARFVPSVVFLPVKERVAGRTIVSFTLTPA